MDTTSKLLNLLKKQSEKLKLISENLNFSNYNNEESYKIFAKFGWYIPPYIQGKTVFDIIELFENDKITEAEKILIKYFKKNLKKIENELINQHKNRSSVLAEGFNAYRKKMFFSSTILFLSQADGICDTIIFSGSKIKKIKDKQNIHPIINILSEKIH